MYFNSVFSRYLARVDYCLQGRPRVLCLDISQALGGGHIHQPYKMGLLAQGAVHFVAWQSSSEININKTTLESEQPDRLKLLHAGIPHDSYYSSKLASSYQGCPISEALNRYPRLPTSARLQHFRMS